MPVWGVWLGGRLWFSSGGRSRKARNLDADPRCTTTTDDGAESGRAWTACAERVTDRAGIEAFVGGGERQVRRRRRQLEFLDPAINGTFAVPARAGRSRSPTTTSPAARRDGRSRRERWHIRDAPGSFRIDPAVQNLWGLTRRRALDYGRMTTAAVDAAPSRRPALPSSERHLLVLARLRRVPFAAQVLLALVLGVALGLVAREIGPVADGTPNWLTSTLATIGGTFVTLLKVLVPPLIVTAVIVSIANLKQVANAARLAGQTLLWFAITALIAVAIGIGLGLLTEPGRNSSVDAAAAADAGEHRRLVGLPDRPGARQHPRPAGRAARRRHVAVVQRPPAHRHRRRHRHRRAQGRRAGRAVPRLRPLRAGDRAEGAVVGHPAGPDRHARPASATPSPATAGSPSARSASSPPRSTPASRWCCSSSTRCCCRRTASRRCGTSPAPGRPSSWPSCPAPRSAPCR